MLNVFHSVLCGDVITDSRSGQVCYHKVIDSVTAPRLPLNISGPYVGALCQAPEGTSVSVRLDILSPDRNTLNLKSFDAVFAGSPQKLLVQLEKVLFTQEGMHQIILSYMEGERWKVAASMPVFVQLSK